jgi:capsular exopolysaccharide synthesis family protein
MPPDKSFAQPALVSAWPLQERSESYESSEQAADPIEYTSTRILPVSLEAVRKRVVLHDVPGAPGTEEMKLLRTHVMFWLAERQMSSVAITSPAVGEGKTTTAINLAMHIAAEVDYTVLLVDANLRAPRVHEYFGLPEGPGLSSHLTRQTPLRSLLINPGMGRLVVLPAGPAIANSAEMLGSRAMGRLVSELKARYPRRIILFDLPPVLDASDAMAFSRHVDGLLMVVAERVSARGQVARAESLLPAEKLIGIALNYTAPARSAKPSSPGLTGRLFGSKR